jgi:FtsZ-interacting cell division protein ZipA
MDRNMLIVIAVAAIAVVLAVIWAMQRRRSAHFKQRFGPEYEQALRRHHDPRAAERELDARERRVAKFELRPLANDDAVRFREAWRQTQTRFVDNPRGAVTDADGLVTEVMRVRGYPIGDFEQRAADISVDHPRVVANYRAARAIAERHARGQASTEDLRQAVVHYRELFAELLDIRDEPMTRTAGGRR